MIVVMNCGHLGLIGIGEHVERLMTILMSCGHLSLLGVGEQVERPMIIVMNCGHLSLIGVGKQVGKWMTTIEERVSRRLDGRVRSNFRNILDGCFVFMEDGNRWQGLVQTQSRLLGRASCEALVNETSTTANIEAENFIWSKCSCQ